MLFMRKLILAFGLLTIAAAGFAQQRGLYQQTEYKGQEIGKLTGDVYYARMDDYVCAFMVTSEGIVLVEPIGVEFGTALAVGRSECEHGPDLAQPHGKVAPRNFAWCAIALKGGQA